MRLCFVERLLARSHTQHTAVMSVCSAERNGCNPAVPYYPIGYQDGFSGVREGEKEMRGEKRKINTRRETRAAGRRGEGCEG